MRIYVTFGSPLTGETLEEPGLRSTPIGGYAALPENHRQPYTIKVRKAPESEHAAMLGKLGSGVKFLPVAALAIGCLLVLAYATRHIPDFFKSMSLKIEHPETYRFVAYDQVLRKYVKDGLVDYQSLKKDPQLAEAALELEKTAPDKIVDPKERACFWINSCNLLALKLITDNYPVTTTEQLSQSWNKSSAMVGGEPISVSSAMNRASNELKDNRIAPNSVFLICKGSLGYPPLTDHAITPETMETDAKVATYQFINNEKNVFYDDEHMEYLLSPLFKRYEPFIRRTNLEPHKFALIQMNSGKMPDLTNLMITKTYFRKIDPTINDLALSSKKVQK
ncbi:MAG: DUF547 domain-containing protein [Candidatus Melainabacteria bacterium]|nr:DUF547 domain-containing protein [Candidatus Melainabacteria bacterium]